MATITKRGTGWFAQVRRKGHTPQYQTFSSKTDAQVWAREQEARIDKQTAPLDLRALRTTSLGDVVRRYLDDVTPKKRSADSERLRLTKLLRDPLCDNALADLTPRALAAYRDARLALVKPGTVRRELSLINHALDVARREWGLGLLQNPLELVSLPALNNARDRRLQKGEVRKLEDALASTRNPLIAPMVRFAIETAMRRAEMLALEWRHIDLSQRTAHIPWSKTGRGRTIPLTDAALAILAARASDGAEGRVFPMTPVSFRLAWERMRSRAGLRDLRFHDLRHEAISRFCELGLTIPEVAVISGHRDPRMLFRYAHLRPVELARKLAGLSWQEDTQVPAPST